MTELLKSADLSLSGSRRSLREEITTVLRAAIIAGQLRPGTVYSVPVLAARFGVSPTPVREAILDIAKDGLIDIVKNKGFRISPLSDQELDEITEVRSLLEIPIVSRLAGQLTPSQLSELDELAAAIVTSAREGDIVSYVEADTRFHMTLLGLAGNSALLAIVQDLRNRSRLYGLDSLVQTGHLDDSAAEHLAMVSMLRAGDADGVAELMRNHLHHVRTIWR